MATCETCGNDYDKAFQVTMNGKAHTFDSFECTIHALAPSCDHCGIRIVGHGLEKAGRPSAATVSRAAEPAIFGRGKRLLGGKRTFGFRTPNEAWKRQF